MLTERSSLRFNLTPCFWSMQVLKVKADDLLPANPDILDGVDDLMQLSYLNEPSVLYNLQYRYNRDMIYVCTNLPNLNCS